MLERLDDERRGDVVREVRDQLARDGVELGDREPERVAPDEPDVDAASQRVDERRLERAVELDGVHEADTIGEETGEDAEARADLEHDVVGGEVAEPADDSENVLVDEEVLAERLLRRDGHGSPNAAVAFACGLHSEVLERLAALLCEHAQRVHDVRGLVRVCRVLPAG